MSNIGNRRVAEFQYIVNRC